MVPTFGKLNDKFEDCPKTDPTISAFSLVTNVKNSYSIIHFAKVF
jgi:hypothetical protein